MKESDLSKLPAVATPTIGGTTLKRHLLDREVSALATLAAKVNRRLRTWLRTMPNVEVKRVVGHDETGRFIEEPVLDENGNPVVQPWLPDAEWRENFELSSKLITKLLVEQRERAKLGSKTGAPIISDEAFEQSLKELSEQAVREMSRAELERLLADKPLPEKAPKAAPKKVIDLKGEPTE